MWCKSFVWIQSLWMGLLILLKTKRVGESTGLLYSCSALSVLAKKWTILIRLILRQECRTAAPLFLINDTQTRTTDLYFFLQCPFTPLLLTGTFLHLIKQGQTMMTFTGSGFSQEKYPRIKIILRSGGMPEYNHSMNVMLSVRQHKAARSWVLHQSCGTSGRCTAVQ